MPAEADGRALSGSCGTGTENASQFLWPPFVCHGIPAAAQKRAGDPGVARTAAAVGKFADRGSGGAVSEAVDPSYSGKGASADR